VESTQELADRIDAALASLKAKREVKCAIYSARRMGVGRFLLQCSPSTTGM
jgi:hypothetical protein